MAPTFDDALSQLLAAAAGLLGAVVGLLAVVLPLASSGALRTRAKVAFAAGFGVVVVMLAYLGWIGWQWTYGKPPAPTATISVPADGDPVDAFPYDGLVAELRHVPQGFTPWIDVFDVNSRKHNPGSHACRLERRVLRCDKLYIGKDEAAAGDFRIIVLAVDAAAEQVIREYNRTAVAKRYPGLDTLPPGTVVLAERQVTRRPAG